MTLKRCLACLDPSRIAAGRLQKLALIPTAMEMYQIVLLFLHPVTFEKQVKGVGRRRYFGAFQCRSYWPLHLQGEPRGLELILLT